MVPAVPDDDWLPWPVTVVLVEYETEVALAIAARTASSACAGDILESGELEAGAPPLVFPPELPVPELG